MGLIVSPMVVPLVIVAAGVYFRLRAVRADRQPGRPDARAYRARRPVRRDHGERTLQGFDANQARAGASLGASPTVVFRRIVLPLILPGVISGALFAFVTSFDEVVVALFLTGSGRAHAAAPDVHGMRENISPVITAAATTADPPSVLLVTALELLRRRSERLRGIRA